MTRGTVRTSTRGGRSVLRSAAAVEAAALRSLTLGASLPLASLGNPLERLVDEAVDLSGIDQVLGRAPEPAPVRRGAGGRAAPGSGAPATSRSSGLAGIGSAAGAAIGGPGAVAPGGIGTAARAAATALQAAAGVGSSVAAALVPGVAGDGQQAAGSRGAGPAAPAHAGSAQGGAPRPGSGQHANRSGNPSGGQPGAGLDPARVRAGSSTHALRRASRSGERSSGRVGTGTEKAGGARPRRNATPDTTASRASQSGPATLAAGPRLPEVDRQSAGSDRSALHGSSVLNAPAPGTAAYPESAQPANRAFTGGGLAELVARWQDSGPDSFEPSVDTAPAWTPLTSTGFDRERPLRLGDEDRIELALEQILRREVERHGLEGGR